MMAKLQFPILLFLFLTVSVNFVKGQELSFIEQQLIFGTYTADDNSFYDGEIHLKNSEILKGSISLNLKNHGQYATLLIGKDEHTYIPNDEINYVLVSDNDQSSKTKFVSIQGQSKLFRELYRKNDQTIVYDLLEKPFDGRIMNDIHIKAQGKLVSIFDFWTSGPKKDLINYINKRDGMNYRRRDFKSLDDLFAKL